MYSSTCLPGIWFCQWKRESPELITRLHPAPTLVDVRSSLAWCIDLVGASGPIFLEMGEEENKKIVENGKAYVDGTSPAHPCVPIRPSFICRKLVECIASMNDNSRPPSPNAPPQDLWSTILKSPSSLCSIPATNVLVLQLARVPSYLPFSKTHLQMPASINHVQTLH